MPVLLDPRPQTLRGLTDDEAKRLDLLHAGLPRDLEHCITCGGEQTFLWKGVDGKPTEFQCNCIDQRIMHRYFLHCGLGLLYQRKSWADAGGVDPKVMDEVFEYLDHIDAYVRTGRGLILRGAMTGTGKTLVAALLFKAMLVKGIDGYFTQFNDMLEGATAGWGGDADARAWFARRVRNAGVLVIDDVGRENAETSKRGLGMVESIFDQVVRARHDNCKPTIITTNKSDEFWLQKYRSNVMSLLSGTCQVIEVTGDDYRPTHNLNNEQEARLGLIRPVVFA